MEPLPKYWSLVILFSIFAGTTRCILYKKTNFG
jgi:hypothetical protein